MNVQRGSPTPLYYQIKQDILERISKGDYAPGYRLPGESEMCKAYGVSKITVIRALNDLSHEGVLRRIVGKGTYVVGTRVEQGLLGLSSFSEEMKARNLTPGSRLIEAETMLCDERLAAKLSCNPGDRALMCRRLRLADSEPIGIQTTYLRASYVDEAIQEIMKGQLASGASLYDFLHQHGLRPTEAVEHYAAVTIKGKEAKLLEVPSGSPGFLVERVGYLGNGAVIEFGQSLMRGDRYGFAVRLVRRDD